MLKPASKRQAELDRLKKLRADAQKRAAARVASNAKVAKKTQGREPMFVKKAAKKELLPKKKPLSPKTPAGQRALKLKKQKTAAEMGSRPVQERDTGLGGMTSGGPTTRRKKPVIRTTKKIVKKPY